MARNLAYDKAYRHAHLKEDAARHRARRLLIKEKGKAALAGKDVDHKNGNPLNNSRSNLHITSVHYNRAKH
ncbi:HNH nuclease [uncultured Caudovirales phage]|uniref:HNH nuclease n=1 Tax=uncultured Caudovirales phage TaxID=2100421 RepID=A0A6J5KUU7_9CAUD|nr:HNH nuclease [uncultured Caudovirales phage]